MSSKISFQSWEEFGDEPRIVGYCKEDPKEVLRALYDKYNIYRYKNLYSPVDRSYPNNVRGLIIVEASEKYMSSEFPGCEVKIVSSLKDLDLSMAKTNSIRDLNVYIDAVSSARATGKSWNDVLKGLVEISLKTGYSPTSPDCYGRYLESFGWKKRKQPIKDDRKKLTAKEFCVKFNGKCVAHIGSGHITCIEDHHVLDTWDCTDWCVGVYWSLEDCYEEG